MRTYQPRPKIDRTRRMAVAARLHAEGLSLRQIGKRLSVSYQTIARDLDEWDQKKAEMPPAILRLSRPAVTNVAPGVTDVTARCDSDSNVIPLRRSA